MYDVMYSLIYKPFTVVKLTPFQCHLCFVCDHVCVNVLVPWIRFCIAVVKACFGSRHNTCQLVKAKLPYLKVLLYTLRRQLPQFLMHPCLI